YSDQLNLQRQHILPGYLKKAQKYIQDHLEQPISLADLSQCCEVSIRTLQKGFSQYLQKTPVEYISDQRLERVHQALQQAQTNETV
ncbi:AraC family transcriptional regulator, partial [Klebsiella pneumoniae]|uniref:AraC family transcriptional regulator n=1 Tax=Klebsiella pneumoniae TaxID=573 RepID=UPI00226D47F0